MFKDFLLLNLNQFENIKFNFPIGFFLVFTCVALCVALFIYNYQKSHTVRFLKGLVRHGATSEAKALSLKKLRLEKSVFLKSALSRKLGKLCHIVSRVGESKENYEQHVEKTKQKGYKEEKINFEQALFYIKENNLNEARDEIERADTSWLTPAIASAIIIALTVTLSIFLKDILTYINNAL